MSTGKPGATSQMPASGADITAANPIVISAYDGILDGLAMCDRAPTAEQRASLADR